MTEIINTQINAKADFSGLINQIRAATTQLSQLQKQLAVTNTNLSMKAAAANQQFADALKASGQFSTHFVNLTTDTEKFGKSLDQGRLKLKEYYGAWQQYHKQAGGLVRDLAKQQVALQNAIVQPMGPNSRGQMQMNVHVPTGVDEIVNKSRLAKQELSIMNKILQDGSVQLINWGKNTQWAGRQLTVGLTVPLAALGKTAADAFAAADAELVRLTKVYGGLAPTSQAELKKVRQDVAATAKELAASYGVSFKDTIALAADIAATGKQGNELLGSLRETTRLSVLGEVSRQDAMKATLAIQNAFKQNTEGLTQSINFLNAVENQTSTTLQDLVDAIPKAGPVVKGLGGDVKDLALMMVAMKEGGIDAASAANGLKSALGSLINPTKRATDLFASFGIDLKGIVDSNAGHVTDMILALQKAMDKLNPLQKQQAIEQLFGKFQFARMGALFDNLGRQGSQTLQVLDLMKASTSELAGIAGRELSQVTDSASGRYKRALESLRAQLALTGQSFLTFSTSILKFASSALNFFNKLPDPVKKFVAALGGITALVGPAIMLTGVFANFIGYIAKAFTGIRSFFSHADKFQLLTPELVAADQAGKLMENQFYSDAKAAQTLQTSLAVLKRELLEIQQIIASGTISVAPVTQKVQSFTVAQTEAAKVTKGQKINFAHYNPQSNLTEEQKAQQSFHVASPHPSGLNKAIENNPQMIVAEGQNIPTVPGLTHINGVSTAMKSSDIAQWHTYMTVMATKTKEQIALIEAEMAATGKLPVTVAAEFESILPKMQMIADTAAKSSAAIAAKAEQNIISVQQASAYIQNVNAAMIAKMEQLSIQSGVPVERMTMVPGTNEKVYSGGTFNLKSLFRSGGKRVGGMLKSIAGRTGSLKLQKGAVDIQVPGYAGGLVGLGVKLAAGAFRGAPLFLRRMLGLSLPKGARLLPDGGYITAKGVKVVSEQAKPATGLFGKQVPGGRSLEALNKQLSASGLKGSEIDDYIAMLQEHAGKGNPIVGSTSTLIDSLPKHLMSEAEKRAIKAEIDREFLSNLRSIRDAGITYKDEDSLYHNISEYVMTKHANRNPYIAGIWDEWSRSLGSLNRLYEKDFLRGAGHTTNALRVGVTDPTTGKIIRVQKLQGGKGSFFLHANNPDFNQAALAGRISNHKDGVTKLPGYGGGDIIPAMLEPGESVVTKQATQRYAPVIQAMNDGTLPGFVKGVTAVKQVGKKAVSGLTGMANGAAGFGVGVAGMLAGNAIGQQVGGNTGGMIGQFAGPVVLGRIIKMGSALVTAARAGTLAQTAMAGLAGAAEAFPGVALATALTVVAVKLYKMHEAAVKNKQAVSDSFKLTKKEAEEAGIKYVNLNTSMQGVLDTLKKQREANRLLAESSKAAGVPGIAMTTAEMAKMKAEVKKTMPDIIKMFNDLKPENVINAAKNLKIQFIAAGMSADEANKKIYALLQNSNKAAQALGAVANQGFMEIKDKSSAAISSIQTFNKLLTIGADAKHIASAFDTTVAAIDAMENGLVGTKDAEGKVIDKAKAIQITYDKINSSSLKNVKLGEAGLKALTDQNPLLVTVLKSTDSIGASYAKMKLYLSGITGDLRSIGEQQAKNMLLAQQASQSETNALITTGKDAAGNAIKDNPFQGIIDGAAKANTAAQRAAAYAKKMAAIAADGNKKEIQTIQDKIKAIQKEADAKKKALEQQQQDTDLNLQIQQKTLEYQNAIATGNDSAAQQARLDILRLVKQQQTTAATRAIEDAAAKATAEQETALKKAEAKGSAAQGVAQKAADAQTAAEKRAADIAALQSSLEQIINERNTYGKKTDANKLVIEGLDARFKELIEKLTKLDPTAAKSVMGGSTNYGDRLQQLSETTLSKAATDFGKGVANFGSWVLKLQNAANGLGEGSKDNPIQVTMGSAATQLHEYDSAGMKTYNAKNNKNITEVAREDLIRANKWKKGTYFIYEGQKWVVTKGYDTRWPNTPGAVRAATGGMIFGPGTGTSDSIPAMLSRGEYVVNAQSVQAVGVATMDKINRMRSGGLAYGNINSMGTGGRYKFAGGTPGGTALGQTNITYDITINGSGLSASELMAEIEKQAVMKQATIGRIRHIK